MRKPRILIASESHFLPTGYGVYAKELLTRLHATDKYELCELGSFGARNIPETNSCPWVYLPVLPDPNNKNEVAEYDSSIFNKFGAYKFEPACLLFKPDIVWVYRDPWYDEMAFRSPFRPFYHLAAMATVDAIPQNPQWVEMYCRANSVHTYTDWGLEVYREAAAGRMNLISSAPPGADFEIFSPSFNKSELRRQAGIPEDSLVIGFTGRNQVRKLFPDLLEAFAAFLDKAPKNLQNTTYLHLHTGFPDFGWDIPRLVLDSGIANRCLFTYRCRACSTAFTAVMQGVTVGCPSCGKAEARMAGPEAAVSRKQLAQIMSSWDVYVQYATCEGFGMPMVEAAACGVPVLAVDYSAMSDVVRKIKGRPIKVQRLFWDVTTGRKMALPDNNDLVCQLIELLSKPRAILARIGFEGREAAMEHYTYERTAAIWQETFDTIPLRPHEETWRSPPRLHTPIRDIPENLPPDQFVRWCISYVGGRPDLCDSYMTARMSRDLTWGKSMGGCGGVAFHDFSAIGLELGIHRFDFTRENVLQECLKLCEYQNKWERRRAGIE